MRKVILLCVIGAALVAIAAGKISAQERRLNSATPEFRTFYSRFIAAVHRGDKSAVASMTSFPLIYGFDTGDEGKMTRTEFMRTGFRRMFGRSPAKFLVDRNPNVSSIDKSYTVSTKDATHLVFTKGGNRYFFTDYIVEP
jgi:hypothetical protein